MIKFLMSAAAIALAAATPASAQILGGGGGGGLGGGVGGGLGGGLGGLGGRAGGTLGGTIERTNRTTTEASTRVRAAERAERKARARRGDRGVASTVTAGSSVDGTVRRSGRGVTGAVTAGSSVDGATRLGERRIVSRNSASADAGLTLDQRMLRTRGAVAATRRGLRRVGATASGVQVFVPSVAVAAPAVPSFQVRRYPAYSSAYYYGPDAVFVGSSHVDVYVDRQHQDLEASLRGTGATVERRGDDLVVLLPADVTFAFDRDDIRPRFYGALSAFARTINAYPGTDIEIVGHTDAVGTETYNLGLSERRGRSVAEFLAAQQVTPERMVVEAMGEAEPVASNVSVAGRAANRRVELIVHPRAG